MRKLPRAYVCRRCGKTHTYQEYKQSRFCRSCEAYLISKNVVPMLSKPARKRRVIGKATEESGLPPDYEPRKGQVDFINEASKAINNNQIFFGSAPCGIGKSLASLLAILPTLRESKLLVCFRTRSQLDIYLKELRVLKRSLSAVSFFSKQDMCPLRVKGSLSYFEFFEECQRLKDNCETASKPYCKFYWNIIKKKKEAEQLALGCARRILAPGKAVRQMAVRGFCAYEALKRVLDQVDIFLGTYHYVFNPRVRVPLLNSLGSELSETYLIVDEAHNLPSFSRELLSDRLTQKTIERAFKETEAFEHEALPSVRECLNILNEEIFEHAQRSLKSEEIKQLDAEEVSDLFLNQSGLAGSEAAEILHEYGEHVRDIQRELGHERILSYNHRAGEFMQNFFEKVGTNYIHLIKRSWRDRTILEVRSFDGREVTDSVLRKTLGTILMSGFLSPPKVYRDLMLYDEGDTSLREFSSPFPPENRLILAASDVSSKFEKRTDKMLQKWKNYIEAISDANEGNIAVFSTSYTLMKTILPLIKTNRKQIVEQRKTERGAVIEQLAESDNNILFGVMGGKFSEGIDYPDNLLTCVVAVGLPYATWGVHQRALIDYFNRQFPGKGRTYAYLTPAILRLIQTCGRVHRSANDKGCIIILDQRVTCPRIKQQLPTYYQKEMKTVAAPTDCDKEVRRFWQNIRERLS